MKNLKKMMLCALTAMFFPVATWAQNEDEEKDLYAELNADVVTNFIWRGQDLSGLSVQPSMTVGWKGLSLNAWGSVSIANEEYHEMDLTLAYEVGGLTLSVCDYWSIDAGETGKYLDYSAHSTRHTFEGTAGYDFGLFSLMWSTVFAGSDYDEDGTREYSSYLQADIPFTLGGFEGVATVGATPWDNEFYGANRFMVCETAVALSKEVKLTSNFSVNATGKVVVNPATEDAFFVLGLGF